MKVMIVQYGNYAEAYHRFEKGGPETFRDQRLSVNYVAAMARTGSVTTIAICEDEHDVELTEGLHSIGVAWKHFDKARIAQLFDRLAPDVLVCCTPHREVLRQAKARQVQTLPLFADVLTTTGLRSALRNLHLRVLLSGRNVPCVANHSLNASRSVAEVLRYPKDRIVPWDWSRVTTSHPVKAGVANPDAPRAFFAGSVNEGKGVTDCLRALRILRDRGVALTMTFAGPGDLDRWRAEAETLGVAAAASFIGPRPNDEVRQSMHEHDIVMVPSRRSYAEGLPNTIYEGLASRSPLVISDHPAFVGRLKPDAECVVFEASNPASLADGLRSLCEDRDLYARLSENAPKALEGLHVGIEWSELMTTFLTDPKDSTGWVARHSLRALAL